MQTGNDYTSNFSPTEQISLSDDDTVLLEDNTGLGEITVQIYTAKRRARRKKKKPSPTLPVEPITVASERVGPFRALGQIAQPAEQGQVEVSSLPTQANQLRTGADRTVHETQKQMLKCFVKYAQIRLILFAFQSGLTKRTCRLDLGGRGTRRRLRRKSRTPLKRRILHLKKLGQGHNVEQQKLSKKRVIRISQRVMRFRLDQAGTDLHQLPVSAASHRQTIATSMQATLMNSLARLLPAHQKVIREKSTSTASISTLTKPRHTPGGL